ncbi:MAG: hypothetical protein ACXWWO_00465 [Candidatus Limnocylindria bacterium]
MTIRVSDRDASERFYDTVLPTIGIEAGHRDGELAEWGDFSIAGDGPATRRLHVGFAAVARARRRVLARRHRGRLPRQRSAGGAIALPPRLLQRVRARSDGHNVEVVNHHR